MVNKLTGLVALALLAGGMSMAAVGCSSDSNNDADGSTDDGGTRPPVREGGASSSGGEECTASEVDASYFAGYPGSKLGVKGSCSASEIAALKALTNITTFKQFADAVGETCASCFSVGVDGDQVPATDVPLILYLNSDPARGFINEGWCPANESAKVACGTTFASYLSCPEDVCVDAGCGTTDPSTGQLDAEGLACAQGVAGSDTHSCNEIGLEKLDADCGADVAAIYKKCYQDNTAYADWINLGCGPDGNTTPDAGTPDSGNDPE